MTEVVRQYRYAIFFTVEGPSAIVAGPIEVRMVAALKVAEIASRLEGAAFYDGYYLSLGLATGSCKRAFCMDIQCPALKPGQACIEPLRARSSPEAVGMDIYLMATRVGWDIYPCGVSTKEADVPLGRRCGLVLIY
jgi:predicted metal-binding protein